MSVAAPADDLEDVQEDVDDVQVEVQRSEHILLGTQGEFLVPQEQLRVHGQELQHNNKQQANDANDYDVT